MAHSSDRYGPPGGGRHRLVGYGDPTGPVLMGRRHDDDHDGTPNYLDPDSPEYEGERDELGGALLARSMVAAGAARGGLNGAVIRAALASIGAVGGQIGTFDDLAAGATTALRQSPRGLTKEGVAAFLATCAQESAYFRTTTEYGKNLRYDPYRGRTFTQITWESGYRGFGQWCKARGLVNDPETFVKNPASLSDLRWAWLGPMQYWETHGIWRWANAGQFRSVSQAINGGNGKVGTSFTPHGWDERQAMYAAFLRAGDALLPGASPAPAPPRPKGLPEMIERPLPPGDSSGRLCCPTGAASDLVGRAWASVTIDGSAHVQLWAQRADPGKDVSPGAATKDKAERDWTLRRGDRAWFELPSGTEYLTYRITGASGPGSLLIEQAPK